MKEPLEKQNPVMSVLEGLQSTVTELVLKVDDLCVSNRQPRKVTDTCRKIEVAIRERGKIRRAELQRIVGASDSAISRDLKSLEAEGKILRYVDPKDSRMTVCVWNTDLEHQSVLDDDIALLELVKRFPQLTYIELRKKAMSPDFGMSYTKLLAHGLIEQIHDDGRLFAIITSKGLNLLEGGDNV